MNVKINKIVDELADELILLRHRFHQNPELSYLEENTARLIKDTLDKWGIPYIDNIFKTSICVCIGNDENKRTLLIRADMDALPITEKTGLSYASGNEGVMHACGHDMHMTVALGAAYVLNKLKDELNSNIKIIFQPGEEDEGGALPMIEAGILENPKVTGAISCHVSNEVDCGRICIKKGALMASPDDFDVIIRGKGGHGAYRNECIDPVLVAAKAIDEFISLGERENEPDNPVVISVCKISGGSFYNIIPDSVSFGGTVRSFSEEKRCELKKKLDEILKSISEEFGADYSFTYNFRYPPLVNDEDTVENFEVSAKEILGRDNVYYTDKVSMAGEDFAYFAERVPSVFFNLGTRNEKIGAIEPLHSSKFIIDDSAIAVGVKAICAYASTV